jgi:Domain of Unknown Function (DUF930)
MNRLIVAVIAIFAGLPASYARTSNTQQMLTLSPETRLEQRCNARAMGIVGREHRDFHPDEFVAYAFADPLVHGNSIKAPGGAVRSRGKWFHVSYECQTTADGLDVESFSYSLGSVIPRDVWAEHFLVP